jgi:hypothetical protein
MSHRQEDFLLILAIFNRTTTSCGLIVALRYPEEELTSVKSRTACETPARPMLAMFHYDVTKEIESLRVPALIIAANKDRLTLPMASHEMDGKLPD